MKYKITLSSRIHLFGTYVCFKLKKLFSLLAPIWRNPDFPPSCQDPVFKLWKERGLDQLVKLYEGGTMESFEGLQSKYSLHQSQFYRYLQIRHYIPKNIQAPNESFLESILRQPMPKRFISCVYETLGLNSNCSTDRIRRQWQNDIECQTDEVVWAKVIENTLKISSCNNDRERQFKILHRLHFTPLLRGRLGLGSANCHKCDTEVGTYAHVMEMCKDSKVLGRS